MGIFLFENNRFQPIKICTLDYRTFAYFPKSFNNPMILMKKWNFFEFLFLGKNNLEIIIGNLLYRKV